MRDAWLRVFRLFRSIVVFMYNWYCDGAISGDRFSQHFIFFWIAGIIIQEIDGWRNQKNLKAWNIYLSALLLHRIASAYQRLSLHPYLRKPRNPPIHHPNTYLHTTTTIMRSPTPTRNSKPKTLRKKLTLLSLSILGFSATPTLAQEPSTTSTWGLPFSVEGPSSTERLVPSSALASSAASVASSQISAIVSSESVSGSGSVPVISGSRTRSLQVSRSAGLVSDSISSSRVGTSFTATLPNTTMSPLTVSTPIVVLHSSTVLISTTATTTGTGSVLESTGSAVPGPRPYVRMGALGVIVGAAGVVMA